MTGFAATLPGRLLIALAIGAVCGVISFVAGQLLPRDRFNYDAFPYRAFKWEKGGAIYEKIGVRAWKDHLPDMSRVVPQMVKKKASTARDEQAMERLVRETCVAEVVHWSLIIIVSPIIGVNVGGSLGAVAAILYALGNMLFVIIQRYNRPRLLGVLRRMEERNKRC